MKRIERLGIILGIIYVMKNLTITIEDLREHWFEIDDEKKV